MSSDRWRDFFGVAAKHKSSRERIHSDELPDESGKAYFAFLSDISINDMNPAEIYSFIDDRLKFGLSSHYVSDIVIMMKSIFKYVARVHHIFNPLESITLPKSKEPDIVLLDEDGQAKLERYIAEKPSKTTLGIALSMSTGIRIGKLVVL